MRSAAHNVALFLFNHYSRDGAPAQPDARALLLQGGQGMGAGRHASHGGSGGANGYYMGGVGATGGAAMVGGGAMAYAPQNYSVPAFGALGGLAPGTAAGMGGVGGVSSVLGTAMLSGPGVGKHAVVTLELTVPKRFLGHIIGKQGKSINAVRQNYAVEIKVDQEGEEELPMGQQPATHTTMRVTGSRDSIWPAAGKCVSNLVLTGGSQAAQQQGLEDGGEAVPAVEEFNIDNNDVARIIGKGGTRINLIRSCSSCKVSIEQLEDGAAAGEQGALATVRLEGTTRQLVAARMLITAKVCFPLVPALLRDCSCFDLSRCTRYMSLASSLAFSLRAFAVTLRVDPAC